MAGEQMQLADEEREAHSLQTWCSHVPVWVLVVGVCNLDLSIAVVGARLVFWAFYHRCLHLSVQTVFQVIGLSRLTALILGQFPPGAGL